MPKPIPASRCACGPKPPTSSRRVGASSACARTPEGELEIRADLVVGADGRHSLVREKAGLAVEDIGAPMDALWMRLPRRPDDPEQPVGRFGAGEITSC